MRLNQITESPVPVNGVNTAEIKKQIAELEKQVYQIEIRTAKVRQITKEIKYDDTVSGIISRVTLEAEKAGIDLQSLDLKINEVFQAQQALESVVYGLATEFTDASRELENQIANLQDQLDFPNT